MELITNHLQYCIFTESQYSCSVHQVLDVTGCRQILNMAEFSLSVWSVLVSCVSFYKQMLCLIGVNLNYICLFPSWDDCTVVMIIWGFFFFWLMLFLLFLPPPGLCLRVQMARPTVRVLSPCECRLVNVLRWLGGCCMPCAESFIGWIVRNAWKT